MAAEQRIHRERITPLRTWAAIEAFSLLLIVLAWRHAMWRDEVRALSVAIDAPSWAEMFASLHHEGHPAVWYILLRSAHAIAQSNLVLPALAIIIGVVTAYLILRHAPFPVWLRLLCIFGAFLGYELSVVARNYGIGVLLMVTACIVYPARGARPWLLGLVLALMANTSVHAAVAALVLACFWLTDAFDQGTRGELLSARGSIGVALALAGIAASVGTARPTPDMAWAFSVSSFDVARFLRVALMDPGASLMGYAGANIAAAQEFPWHLAGIPASVASRMIVNVSLLWLAWQLRHSWRALAAMVLSILAFASIFRIVYTGGTRHEGLLLFLILSVCWMAAVRRGMDVDRSRRIALGLLPLFAIQAAALPFVVRRQIQYPASSSKAFAGFIERSPRYRDAILMAEPDFMMESLRFYVDNPVYMPRQREFSNVVYFDNGARRQRALTLAELMSRAESISCMRGKKVLLAMGYDKFSSRPSGVEHPPYRGTDFTWEDLEWTALTARQPRKAPVAEFRLATSDEIYSVYEVSCR